MLKIVSENFIHALLLFLGLFLNISRWVPLFIKRETGKFHVVVVQRRQRNVQKSVMHVQSFVLQI